MKITVQSLLLTGGYPWGHRNGEAYTLRPAVA